jgi:hypothetical protein
MRPYEILVSFNGVEDLEDIRALADHKDKAALLDWSTLKAFVQVNADMNNKHIDGFVIREEGIYIINKTE